MIAEIIEPNPILVEYIQISNLLWTLQENITEIENLREKYYELLKAQPTHWIK
jgi:hypothetical protein